MRLPRALVSRLWRYKVSFKQLEKDAPLPCIVHWKLNHFIVVYQIKKQQVYVADPALGLLTYASCAKYKATITKCKDSNKTCRIRKIPKCIFGCCGLGSSYSSAASKEYNYFNQLGFNLNQFARLSVSIPINTGQVRGRIINAEINQRIVKIQLSQTKLQLKQEFEQAYLATKNAQEKQKFAQKQVSAQQIAYDSAKDRYLEGLLHSIEYF